MSLRRIWAMFVARSREFYRDRAAFGWNVVFPFLLVGGFALIFGGENRNEYKVGIFPCDTTGISTQDSCLPDDLAQIKQIAYIGIISLEQGMEKLKHHKIDMLLRIDSKPYPYWINETSPKGYVVERMISGSLMALETDYRSIIKQTTVVFKQIRYIDWFFPGVVGMSMMFSALYGVGYVIVRYRKNGVLKRLEATPLTAFEYLTSQLLSRLCMIAFSVAILWIGSDLVFDFNMEGSYLDLIVLMTVGCLSLITLGLVIASRSTSEEFAEGLLNLINWPMMFLSGVWFSIEGAPRWLQTVAQLFPLTHLLKGMRDIINDGASLASVKMELIILFGMTILFLTVGALLFKWNK
jgi:ABC-2 type transport system permease protein